MIEKKSRFDLKYFRNISLSKEIEIVVVLSTVEFLTVVHPAECDVVLTRSRE